MACNNYNKSTLVANAENLNVAADTNITFNTNAQQTGTSIVLGSGLKNIYLRNAGLYEVNISATGTAATAGDISLEVLVNNAPIINGTTSTYNDATNGTNMSLSTIIEVERVCPCSGNGAANVVVNVVNTGATTTYDFVDITIVKIA